MTSRRPVSGSVLEGGFWNDFSLGVFASMERCRKAKERGACGEDPPGGRCCFSPFHLAGTHRGGAEDWSSYVQIENNYLKE